MAEGFTSSFVVDIKRSLAWERLCTARDPAGRRLLPAFDASVEVLDETHERSLTARKLEEPCRDSTIELELADAEVGTSVTISQHDFGPWFASARDVLEVGWRHIVADVRVLLATGAEPHRHMRAWGDLGASMAAGPGGVIVAGVRPGGLADRLGMRDGDLLVVLAEAPVSCIDDLVTILRVIGPDATPRAEFVRDGALIPANL